MFGGVKQFFSPPQFYHLHSKCSNNLEQQQCYKFFLFGFAFFIYIIILSLSSDFSLFSLAEPLSTLSPLLLSLFSFSQGCSCSNRNQRNRLPPIQSNHWRYLLMIDQICFKDPSSCSSNLQPHLCLPQASVTNMVWVFETKLWFSAFEISNLMGFLD